MRISATKTIENRSELNTIQARKRRNLSHNYSHSVLKDIVVNRALPPLNGGSLKITRTAPLKIEKWIITIFYLSIFYCSPDMNLKLYSFSFCFSKISESNKMKLFQILFLYQHLFYNICIKIFKPCKKMSLVCKASDGWHDMYASDAKMRQKLFRVRYNPCERRNKVKLQFQGITYLHA